MSLGPKYVHTVSSRFGYHNAPAELDSSRACFTGSNDLEGDTSTFGAKILIDTGRGQSLASHRVLVGPRVTGAAIDRFKFNTNDNVDVE